MSQTANIERFTLKVGDEIGFDCQALDLDIDDWTTWVKISAIVTQDGETAYRATFPDGEPLNQSILAKHVGKFRKAVNYSEPCQCGRPITTDSMNKTPA